MTGTRQDPASVKVRDALAHGTVHFDLTTPPDRDEAGMPAGESYVAYQRPDHTPIQVEIDLPGGQRLTGASVLLTFSTYTQPNPAQAEPASLDLHVYPADLAAGRDLLLAEADRYGLDRALVTAWYDEARGPRPVPAPPAASSPWLATTVGYLRLEVQGRYTPPVPGESGPGQTEVHYLLTWSPAPGTRAS